MLKTQTARQKSTPQQELERNAAACYTNAQDCCVCVQLLTPAYTRSRASALIEYQQPGLQVLQLQLAWLPCLLAGWLVCCRHLLQYAQHVGVLAQAGGEGGDAQAVEEGRAILLVVHQLDLNTLRRQQQTATAAATQ